MRVLWAASTDRMPVEALEGKIETQSVQQSRRRGRSVRWQYYYVLGERRFEVSRGAVDALDPERPYRVYVTAWGDLLSLEPAL